MEEFKFACPDCDQHLQTEVSNAGRQIECPGCHHQINIPNAPAGSGFTYVEEEHGNTWNPHVPKIAKRTE